MSEETRVALLPWPSIILEPRGEVFGIFRRTSGFMTIESILGGDEGKRETVDVLAVEGGK